MKHINLLAITVLFLSCFSNIFSMHEEQQQKMTEEARAILAEYINGDDSNDTADGVDTSELVTILAGLSQKSEHIQK